MEQASRGLLEGLRAQAQPLSHSAMLSSEDMASLAAVHQAESKSLRDSSAQGAFTSTGEWLIGSCSAKRINNTCDCYCLGLTDVCFPLQESL